MDKLLHDSHLHAYECDMEEEEQYLESGEHTSNYDLDRSFCADTNYEINYESLIKNNIIIINTFSGNKNTKDKTKKSYIYDIINDKELTTSEVASKLYLEIEEIFDPRKERIDISSDPIKAYVYFDR